MRYHMIQQFCSQVCVITKKTSSLKILHKSFHNSIFLNGQDVETAYLFNNWCIAKPNLGYFSLGNDLGIELLQVSTWEYIGNIFQWERNWIPTGTYHIILFIWNASNRKIHRDGKLISNKLLGTSAKELERDPWQAWVWGLH